MAVKYDYEVAFEAFDRKDYEAVLQYALPHATTGDSDAQCMVSLLYQLGHGVEQDFRKAEEWLIKATEHHSPVAWNNLGSLYASRLPGLSRGAEAAGECYQRAKELGFNCATPYPPAYSREQ
jgi:TPR repeat protein